MSETSIITIVLSLFAVGGTISGTWLGGVLERKNETRKWRREHCLKIYSEFLSSSMKCALEARVLFSIECESNPEHSKQVNIVQKLCSEVYEMLDKLILISPDEVYNKFECLALYCGRELAAKSEKCPKLSSSEWDTLTHDFPTLFSDCRFAARNDLGVFPKRYRVDGFDDIKKSIEELKEGTIMYS